MSGTDKSNHLGLEKKENPLLTDHLVDNLHQDPKLAYKEHIDLDKQIKQTNDAVQNTLKHLAHPTDSETRQTVKNKGKFANAYYKASVGKLIESITNIATDTLKFLGHQQQAARSHDIELAIQGANSLKPVGEAIGAIPKIAQQLNDLKPQQVLDKAKTPEGAGTLLGGILFMASQFELPGGNKLQGLGELKSFNAVRELSNVSKLEAEAHAKYAFLKTTAHAGKKASDTALLGRPVKMQLNSGRLVEAVETQLPGGAIQRKFRDTRGAKEVEITQTKDAEKTVTEWHGNKVTQYAADKRKVHEKPDGTIETTYRNGRKETQAADGTMKTTFEKPIPLGSGDKLQGEGEVTKPHSPKMPTEAEIGKTLEAEGLVKLGKNGRYEQTDNNCWDIASRLAKKFGYDMPDSKAAIIKLTEDHLGRRAGYRPNLPMPKDGGYLIIREIPGNLTEPMHITFASGGQEYNFGVTKSDNHSVVLRIPIAKRKT